MALAKIEHVCHPLQLHSQLVFFHMLHPIPYVAITRVPQCLRKISLFMKESKSLGSNTQFPTERILLKHPSVHISSPFVHPGRMSIPECWSFPSVLTYSDSPRNDWVWQAWLVYTYRSKPIDPKTRTKGLSYDFYKKTLLPTACLVKLPRPDRPQSFGLLYCNRWVIDSKLCSYPLELRNKRGHRPQHDPTPCAEPHQR